ncbi:MAG: response regulator, partial [Armatimonadetes bacterium]|nr:response regulator [Armatimonadota bacterium]
MKRKVLVVDDEQNLLDALQRQLRKRFDLRTACGGPEGLECIEAEGPFDVVVSDMRMPEMDGVQFLARVREGAPGAARMR